MKKKDELAAFAAAVFESAIEKSTRIFDKMGDFLRDETTSSPKISLIVYDFMPLAFRLVVKYEDFEKKFLPILKRIRKEVGI